MKKQGLLALTFEDPSHYDKIREDDRISLVGLSELASGKQVECIVKHSDGSEETLMLNLSTSRLPDPGFGIGDIWTSSATICSWVLRTPIRTRPAKAGTH